VHIFYARFSLFFVFLTFMVKSIILENENIFRQAKTWRGSHNRPTTPLV